MRILILRPDNIGDCVLFSGALEPIRAQWPDARIELAVQSHVRNLLARCPHVDKICSVYRVAPWLGLRRHMLKGTWQMERILLHPGVKRLWSPRYDLVMYAVSAPKEDWLSVVRSLHAKEKWGFSGVQLNYQELEDDRNRPEQVFTRTWRNTDENLWMHEIERTRAFLLEMGIACGPVDPVLWLDEKDRHFAIRVLPTEGCVAFFLGAADATRRWPEEKWADLAQKQKAAPVVALFGGASDRSVAGALESRLRTDNVRTVNLAGKTTLRQLAACRERCRACVSNDSAGLHLAVAAGVPAVGLLGGYHFGRYYPWGNPNIHRVAHVPMDCYHCNAVCRYGDFRCVSSIPVECALQELESALTGARRA